MPRPLLLGATLTSTLAAVLGLVWLLVPQLTLLGGPPTDTMLASLFGTSAATLIQTATSLVGVAAGLAGLARILPRSGLFAAGAVQALVCGVALGSMSTLSTAGYLVALAMPAIVLLLIVQVIRRYPRGRWLFGVPALMVAAGGVVLLREQILENAGHLVPALIDQAGALAVTLLLVAIGATWSAVAVLSQRGTEATARATAWVTRHRRLFTIIAACGPLPYALARLTWLTPWPLFGGEAAADPAVQLWGLVLSSGCWLGFLLTLGLIRPWGEVFPRWMPVVAGRPVPIAAAAVPGGTVAALLSFAALPLLVSAAELGPEMFLMFAIAFPCWLWGPALGLAVWGYVGHRRASSQAGLTGPATSTGPTTSTGPDAPTGTAASTGRPSRPAPTTKVSGARGA